MTVCSTIVTMITNFTILWDFFITPNFSESGAFGIFQPSSQILWSTVGSGLTRRQRSLVIIIMIFFSYIALGGLITSLLMNLSFVNGLFFTLVTTLTIGFGD